MLAAACGVAVNIGANYFLIFGHGGFPAMGVAGAAWGTNIGMTIEMLILLCLVLSPVIRNRYNTFDLSLRLRKARHGADWHSQVPFVDARSRMQLEPGEDARPPSLSLV